jgi:hypothetical protein
MQNAFAAANLFAAAALLALKSNQTGSRLSRLPVLAWRSWHPGYQRAEQASVDPVRALRGE